MSFVSTNAGVIVVDSRTRQGTITLPLTTQIPQRVLQLKDLYGAFGRSSLTLSTQAGERFDDGTTSKIFTDPFTFLTFYAGSTTTWAQLGGTQTTQQTMSSLIVSSLTIGTGLGWLQLPPIQTIAISTNTFTGETATATTVSAQVLYVSSIMGAVVGGNITTANLTSTVVGLGTVGYISTPGGGGGITTGNLTSTVQGLATAGYLSSVSGATGFVSSLTVNALTLGTGSGWLQLPPIQTIYSSTIYTQAQALFTLSSYFGGTSSLTTLDFYGLVGAYNNTVIAEVSTGAGTQELLMFKGSSVSDRVRVQTTGTFVVETGVSARLWSDTTVPTLSNVTPAFIINTSSNVGIQTASPGATLDVAGTGRFQFVSTLSLQISSINGSVYSAGGGGLTIIPQFLSTAALTTSSVTASTIITSSLQVNSLTIGTGTGWVNLGPIQTVAVSSLQDNTNALYATSAYIGNLSTLNTLQYNGLFGTYNNTVLAEISTGAGTQELLVFKGSSASDRVRVQTTGAFVVETGVSARLFNSNTTQTLSNATPAMVITTGSNVGIQTASPQATLDVAGAGRFQALSTLSLQISSINGSVYTPGGGSGGGGAISYLSAFTVSTTDIVTSTLSSYAIFTYGVIGTNFFNTSFTESMNVTSITDLNTYSALSTIGNGNAIYQSSSNDIRFVAPSNVYLDTPQVVTSNLFCSEAVSTYSLVVYGPSTLTVQGLSYFENTVSSYGIVTDSLAIVDSATQQPQFIQVTNGVFDFGGAALLDQNILTSTVIGLGTVGYISTQSGGGGGGGPIAVLSSPTKIGSDFTLSQLGFYGLSGDFNTAVVGHQQTGVGTSELILFKGSSINDSIRLTTMGDIRFEPQRAVTTFPTVPALATPTMILQSNLVGIATASPGTELDVAGTGRFVEVSTITVRANVVYTNTLNIAIQTV